MKVTILGSGSFLSSLIRFGPAYLLEIGDKKVLVDTGSGCQIRLLERGIKLEDLDYIFITHFHPDHTTDLASILIRYKMLTRLDKSFENKLKVFGPVGIKEFTEKLFQVYDLPQFVDFPGALVSEMSVSTKLDDFNVRPFVVEHLGVRAQAYRFGYEGKSVVLSGDTTKCLGAVDALNNADLAIIDSSMNKDEEPIAHLNTTQVGEIAIESGVKKVVLTHILTYNEKRDLVAEVKEVWDGDVVLAEDLMEIII